MPKGQRRSSEQIREDKVAELNEKIGEYEGKIRALKSEIMDLVNPPTTWDDVLNEAKTAELEPSEVMTAVRKLIRTKQKAATKNEAQN